MIILLMGVSGAGKTAVGETLASKLGWTFYDGDDFHPAANVHKMSSGKPLTDEDRRPWLDAIRTLIQRLEAEGTDAVIACSALKQAYRDRLLASPDQAQLVYLRGSRELIE